MLLIDSRERSGSKLVNLVRTKAQKYAIPIEQKWLEIGDYTYGDICFEAKSAVDFIGSVMSKRIWNQLDNMDRAFGVNVVMIYGDLDDAIDSIIENSKSKASYASRRITLRNMFYGAIGRITLDTDAKPFYVKDEYLASTLIAVICKMASKERKVIQPKLLKRISTDDMRVDVLSTIKGLSSEKSKKLIDHFGSIMEVGECSSSELQEIEGIGKTLADRIITTLNNEEKVKI